MKCWKIGGNYYSRDKFGSYEIAVKASLSNKRCYNCVDCVNCEGCVSCRDCSYCLSCVGLVSCNYCIGTHRRSNMSFSFRGNTFS